MISKNKEKAYVLCLIMVMNLNINSKIYEVKEYMYSVSVKFIAIPKSHNIGE